MLYLIAARQRYRGFLCLLQRFKDLCSCFVPTVDILLMLLTHQSYPTVYAEDLKDMWDDMAKVVGVWETVNVKDVDSIKKLWERAFDQPYEKAGVGLVMEFKRVIPVKPPVYWEWEFGTKGLTVELCGHCGLCLSGTKLLDTKAFYWNDLLRAPSLTLAKEVAQVSIFASITPPVHAPYLLKCVPDSVTDDSGAMVSDVILKLNNYRPQEGRWLSRTVLNHAGRECFVVRIRVGGGFWRRGGETPSAVKWEDRIIEICEGSWSYVAGSIGRAPVQRKW
ncbi:hypothetical protein SLE2022_125770 [Rubroshorea leprosula]